MVKKLREIYDRFRFLVLAIPFLVLLLPFGGHGWSLGVWQPVIILTQCPFIAVATSVHPKKDPPMGFIAAVILGYFLIADVFSIWSFSHHDSWLACLGILTLLLAIEVAGVEFLGMAMARPAE